MKKAFVLPPMAPADNINESRMAGIAAPVFFVLIEISMKSVDKN